jgi:glycerol-3-phosphate O-acyltransferase
MNQKFALIAITIGLLIAGWMDGQDAAMAEKSSAVAQRYSVKHQGQKLACIKCGQP